jgi:GNAT superfamily N-acetyltransferase
VEAPIRLAESRDLDGLRRMLREFRAEEGYAPDAEAEDAALAQLAEDADAALAQRAEDADAALAQLAEDAALGRVWLILADGEPVGYVAVTFGFSLEYGGRDAFVDELFVRPAQRGRGLGGRTLEAIEPRCAELGVRALHLVVERRNPRALSLYRRHGFRDNDRRLLSKRLPPG